MPHINVETRGRLLVALVATCNRPQLLARRSLPSIANQTRRPQLVIVADDSIDAHRARNQKTVAEFSARYGMRALYVVNRRTRGAGGCWNCGALLALQHANPTDAYLAILDDDDEWLPQHLQNADDALSARRADFLLAAHLRCESKGNRTTRVPPQQLISSAFLVGNPGVIGSTMIIRLSTFMRAGMFDEALPACTDRDLCIRLSALSDVRYRRLCAVSTHHHADDTRVRISNPGGKTKLDGLSKFADKYRGWMNEAEQRACDLRAERLFGWREVHRIKPRVNPNGASTLTARADKTVDASTLNDASTLTARADKAIDASTLNDASTLTARADKTVAASSNRALARATNQSPDQVALIIGVIVDPCRPNHRLFDDILRLSKDKRLSSVEVAVVSCTGAQVGAYRCAVAQWRNIGLRMYAVDNALVNAAVDALGLPPMRAAMRCIGINRMVLQYAVAGIGVGHRAPLYWILDGDTRLHGLTIQNQKPIRFAPKYVDEMLRLRASGCDVAVGGVNGAAPLPRAMSVRTQLVDLMHFCMRVVKPPRQRCYPVQTIANAARHKIHAEYYHDCGAHPHLEQPIGLLPLAANCSYRRLIKRLPQLLEAVLRGDAVTRPLVNDAVAVAATSTSTSASMFHRGGNTLIFNCEILRQCPNGLLNDGFADMRRQDEIWRVFGQAAFGWSVVGGNFPVTQVRADEPPQAPDVRRMEKDIVGHAVSGALRRAVVDKQFNDVDSLVQFLLHDATDLHASMRQLADERAALLHASCWRIAGIANTIRRIITDQSNSLNDIARDDALAALHKLERRFLRAPARIAHVNHFAHRRGLRRAIANFPAFCKRFQQWSLPPQRTSRLWQWVSIERQKNAAQLLNTLLGFDAKLTFLGRGGEGAVFTNHRTVYKVLHNWYSRTRAADIPHADFFCRALHGKASQWNPTRDALYPVIKHRRSGGDLIAAMPYERTTPYRGGCGVGMVALLSALRRRGVVVWDINLNNLRQKNHQVRLVDYGCQIHPLTERDFDLSVRKAWLCFRYADRKNLRALLTRSLTTVAMPQLTGYVRMRKAAEQYAARFRVADDAIDAIIARAPNRVLDYGCGGGRDAIRMARTGITVDAHDPNLSTKAKRRLTAAKVQCLTQNQLDNVAPYDAILVRHVLCEIRSDRELHETLRTLRRLIAKRGNVVITACDMDRIVKQKLYAINQTPRNADCTAKFLYRKQIRINGATRQHVHRPQRVLEKLFAAAGFEVASRKKFAELDLQTMQPCGGALQWTLIPRHRTENANTMHLPISTPLP